MTQYDMSLLWHFVERWADNKPGAEWLIFGEQRINWGDFRDEVNRVARGMLEAGVGKGDRVAVISMARPEFLVTFMAASKIGAVWVGMSPKFTIDELRFQVRDCAPVMLFSVQRFMDEDHAQRARQLAQEFSCIRRVVLLGAPASEPDNYAAYAGAARPEQEAALAERAAAMRAEDDVLLMYTSGSTGKPKGVLHTHRNIICNVSVEAEHFGFDESTRALVHFPINHVAADVELGFTALYAGATLVLMERFDAQASLEAIARERVTAVGQVPVMYLMQFQTPQFREMDWRHVRLFVWSGSAAPDLMLRLLGEIARRTGARLLTGYGSTELCGFCTYSAPGDSVELLARTAGRVVPPFEMRIVDEDRRPLPPGIVGEVCVRGGIVMKGYLNNPEATAEVLDTDGWYYSGDLGCLDEQGYLFLTGRRSEMFKTGGENVFPREVEDVLERHPAVLFAAVLGVPDQMYDEVGYAFVMLKPGKTTTAEELRALCREHLANFKVPKHFDLRTELPLLPNGKVSKMALRKEIGL